MFKPAHGICGILTAEASSIANILAIDANSIGKLETILGSGDWTYLRIDMGAYVEVVRVAGVGTSSVVVDRGIDGTSAAVHAKGATIEYILTAQAVLDMTQQSDSAGNTIVAQLPLHATTDAGITTISIDPLALTSDDGSLEVVGTYPKLSISIDRTKTNCC